MHQSGTPSIAIIGMAGIFPQARTVREYWQHILTKHDCITDVPASHWDIATYYDPDPAAPDKTYCKRGGFIPETTLDLLAFGISPHIVEVTDATQLLGLVVARELLADAGFDDHTSFERERTGVILGVTGGQKLISPLSSRLQYPVWEQVLRHSGISAQDTSLIIKRLKQAYIAWDENAFPGLLGNVVAGRIANRLDLGGINCIVDAACASSLAALKMAVSELAERRCDMIITGGVDLDNSIFSYLCFSKTPAFSRQSHPKPFDQEADGIMIGEAIGMVLLKRLEDAERDGDRIYAVIEGIGTSSDGRHKSIYAPHPDGQVRALERAYEDAGILPASIGLVEAHGTGTVAGDLAEFTALCRVFGADNPRKQHIALGSVKSQIGHTKAAAGAVSLIKAALALHHNILPPTLHVTQPNPKFAFADSPFYLNTEARPWIRAPSQAPHRAAVSSFGFGGTNYHVVLEEYRRNNTPPRSIIDTPQSIVLSAPTPELLLERCATLATEFAADPSRTRYLALVADGAQEHLPQTDVRIGFVADSAEDARSSLQTAVDTLRERITAEAWQHPSGVSYRRHGHDLRGRVVALFAGQGSQYLEMGQALVLHVPQFRQTLETLDELCLNAGRSRLSPIMFPPPSFDPTARAAQSAELQQTANAQPAIGAFSFGLYKLLQQAGFQPDSVAGHSFGELTALWAAGVFSDIDYFQLALARGQAMAPRADAEDDSGAMLAVTGDIEAIQTTVQRVSGDLHIANWNAPNQVVLAGPTAAIVAASDALAQTGLRTTRLPVSAAFHTPMISHAAAPFAEALAATTFCHPKLPVYANATAARYPSDPAEMRGLLAQQMQMPVLFQQQIEQIYAAGGFCFVEIGPRTILTSLVQSILGDRPHLAIALNPHPQSDSNHQLRVAVTQLRVSGIALRALDPCDQLTPLAEQPGRTQLTVQLTGSNYVSKETRQAFEAALQETKPHARSSNHAEASSPPLQSTAAPAPPQSPGVVPTLPAHQSTGVDRVGVLERLDAHQRETLRLHEQHLAQQAEERRTFLQLVQQQANVVSQRDPQPDARVIEHLSHTLALVQEYQRDAARLHERYLQDRADYTRMAFQHLQPDAALPAPQATFAEPVRQENGAAPPGAVAGGSYAEPANNASPSFAAPPVIWPEPQAVPMTPEPAPPLPTPAHDAYQAPAAPVATQSNVHAAPQSVHTTLLGIISEKTGYPAEHLDLDMDMEADLGIDSIKRVEIFGAIQQTFADMPPLQPEDLVELRTLAEIATHLRAVWQLDPMAVPLDATPASGEPAPLPHADPLPDALPARQVVRLHALPPPDVMERTLPPGYCCLMTDDGTATTFQLAQALTARGWNVVVLRFPPSLVPTTQPLPDMISTIDLTDLSEAHLEATFTQITERAGPVGAFVHLHPWSMTSQPDQPTAAEPSQAIVRHIFLLARYMKESLIAAAQQSCAWFFTVVRLDGALGLGQRIDVDAISGGLFGLPKTLNLEWEIVQCRAVDLSPDLDMDHAVQAIIAELYDPNRFVTEVGHSRAGRSTLIAD